MAQCFAAQSAYSLRCLSVTPPPSPYHHSLLTVCAVFQSPPPPPPYHHSLLTVCVVFQSPPPPPPPHNISTACLQSVCCLSVTPPPPPISAQSAYSLCCLSVTSPPQISGLSAYFAHSYLPLIQHFAYSVLNRLTNATQSQGTSEGKQLLKPGID